jgi:hypothetical protein
VTLPPKSTIKVTVVVVKNVFGVQSIRRVLKEGPIVPVLQRESNERCDGLWRDRFSNVFYEASDQVAERRRAEYRPGLDSDADLIRVRV